MAHEYPAAIPTARRAIINNQLAAIAEEIGLATLLNVLGSNMLHIGRQSDAEHRARCTAAEHLYQASIALRAVKL